MIDVLFFGPVAERTGCGTLKTEFRPGMTLKDLQEELAAKYPSAFEIASIAAVDGQHVRDQTMPLADRSEVAFMARFSGG